VQIKYHYIGYKWLFNNNNNNNNNNNKADLYTTPKSRSHYAPQFQSVKQMCL